MKHGMTNTVEFNAWQSMLRRCYCKTNKGYRLYGGRGISVCKSWRESFSRFFQDVGKRPSSKHSIERIDTNGNYEPSNVTWATTKEQANNRRNSLRVEYRGELVTIDHLASIAGIRYRTMRNRLLGGWTVEAAVSHSSSRSNRVITRTRPEKARKLDQQKADEIRALYESGVPRSELAKKFRVGPTSIFRVVNGLRWTRKQIEIKSQLSRKYA